MCEAERKQTVCPLQVVYCAAMLQTGRQCSRQLQLLNTNRSTRFTSQSLGVTAATGRYLQSCSCYKRNHQIHFPLRLRVILPSQDEEIIIVLHTSLPHPRTPSSQTTHLYTQLQTPACFNTSIYRYTNSLHAP